jgi:hypothetical protein
VGETVQEQNRRQLSELLQEARVAMPGVQILFGFLLAVPFQQRFTETTAFQKDVYLITVLLAAATTICFIAPVAYHRIQFERHDKRHLILVSNRFLIAGLAFLAAAMTSAVVLVTAFLFADATMIVLAVALACAFAWCWFGYPLLRRLRGERSTDAADAYKQAS